MSDSRAPQTSQAIFEFMTEKFDGVDFFRASKCRLKSVSRETNALGIQSDSQKLVKCLLRYRIRG